MAKVHETIHYYEPGTALRRDLIAAWEGVVIGERDIESAMREFKFKTGCKMMTPLGLTVDDLGRYQYLVEIHPDEAHIFADARSGRSSFSNEFAWARELCFFSDW